MSVSALVPVLASVALYWVFLIPDTSPGPLALGRICQLIVDISDN